MPQQTEAGADAPLRQLTGDIVLVGAGRMGGALIEGWIRLGLDPSRLAVIEPQPTAALLSLTSRGARLNPPTAGPNVAAIVLAVKPQTAAEAIAGAALPGSRASLVVSIMAGRTIAFLEAALPPGTAVVRAMPNTPAGIGRGITVAVPNRLVSEAQRGFAHTLLAATGTVEWIDDESLMDAVTAVSGSGPAYVFLLAESLARAGAQAGLPGSLAARLARVTVAGAGELMHRSTLEAAALRADVTSPGGTTAAALAVLMAAGGLDALMERAVAAALARSRELGA